MSDSMIGITVGFVVGLFTLHGVEAFVAFIESYGDSSDQTSSHSQGDHPNASKITLPEGLTSLPDAGVNESSIELSRYSKIHHDDIEGHAHWEVEPLAESVRAFSNQDHRKHILEHLQDIGETIASMETRSNRLLEEQNLSIREIEDIAEKIDEEIHNLQYRLDHTRRLVEGSEAHSPTHSGGSPMKSKSNTWVTEERKIAMKQRLRNLKLIVDHTIEHINETSINQSLLEEVHSHINDMDQQIAQFHVSVEKATQKWRRSRELMPTKLGDTLPMGLVVPVTVDCFVDGFLIGVSCAIAPAAGIILGAANCLEMASLGMAYAARINKCTRSSMCARLLALYLPPLLMFLVAGLGALVGVAAKAIPAVFIALVAFGVVALLSLVCNELLIEAKEAQGEDERWYIGLMIFAGVWVILMLSQVFN